MQTWLRALLCLLFCLNCLSGEAEKSVPAPRYTVIDLGTLPPDSKVVVGNSREKTEATAINDAGQIAGSSNGQAFVWKNGGLRGLGTLPPTGWNDYNRSEATAINNRGQVVGASGGFGPIVMSGLYDCNPFLWTDSILRNLGNRKNGASFEPFGINDKGEIVGLCGYRGFYWFHNQLKVLGTISKHPEGNRSRAFAINQQGDCVGETTIDQGPSLPKYVIPYLYRHGFLLRHRSRRMQDLGTLPGDQMSSATAINDHDAVAGASQHIFGQGWPEASQIVARAVLWKSGKIYNLGVLPGARESQALDLNNACAVVGESSGRAFLWQEGVLYDLNILIPPDSGWRLDSANAINNHGQIVGTGTFQGQKRAFLLTPH